jgi:hypothetical protein
MLLCEKLIEKEINKLPSTRPKKHPWPSFLAEVEFCVFATTLSFFLHVRLESNALQFPLVELHCSPVDKQIQLILRPL